MYNADRCSQDFIEGVHYFLGVAEANKWDGFMCCPCAICKNPSDVEGEQHPRKKIHAKVMWYAPIIPRLNVCSEIKTMQSCCGGIKKTVR